MLPENILIDDLIEPSSYVDPNGYVFRYNGEIYRFIHSHVEQYYRDLFKKGIVEKLEKNYSLINSEMVEVTHPKFVSGMVLKHNTITPVTYCVEWCPSMLRDAALVTLELAMALLADNAILQDAYPWNILFKGSKGVHVDFTSIIPQDERLIWPAYSQFLAFFLRPLQLAALGKGKVARFLLFDYIEGISSEEFSKHTSFSYKIKHPLLFLQNWLDHLIQNNDSFKKNTKELLNKRRFSIDALTRKRFFQGLKRKIEQLDFSPGGRIWSDYYEKISNEINREIKLTCIRRLLTQLTPKTVLDIGSNTGVFSIEAAQYGADVISIDSSETCIEHLYARVRQERLSITPIVADILTPTPAFGFMGEQYPSLLTRIKSDLVLCLGLMHHLHITGRQSFDRIAKLLSNVTKQHLVFEYIDKDDDNIVLIGSNRTIDYSLDSVLNALSGYFQDFEIFDSDRTTRKIIRCSRANI